MSYLGGEPHFLNEEENYLVQYDWCGEALQ